MKSAFFTANRSRLIEVLGKELIVLAGSTSMQRSHDMSFPLEQEANFWWLCGIEAPDWRLIIDSRHAKSYLIAPKIDAMHHMFDGSLDWKVAQQISGVDGVMSALEGEALLAKLANAHNTVWTLGKDPSAGRYNFSPNPAPQRLLTMLKKRFVSIKDCRLELARLRAIKQPPEIQALRRAIALTVEAFEYVKSQLSTYSYEYEVEAAFTHSFRHQGAKGHAYDPIVAAGAHACTLHYVQNDGRMKQNELLLLDIGARVDGYAADITRTYHIGKVTARQKAVHVAVEAAHHEIIALLRPGLLVNEYQEQVDTIMKQKLRDLGLLKRSSDYRRYFPHAISHGLGVDVHDALGRPTEFLEGMVLTVEPGIYIPEEGIGVRIEDDVLITKDGHENLSAALPTSL